MNLTKTLIFGMLPVPVLMQTAERQKPNVLVIISDDQSVPHLGCYGNSDIKTPNLDRFAKEGMLFWRGYVTCPQSAPSRASILTGRSPIITMTARFGAPLDRSVITYPEYLISEAGYYAGLCGRTHHQDGKPGPRGSFLDKFYREHNLSTMESRMQYVKIAAADEEGGEERQIAQFYEFMDVRDKGKPFYLQFCFTDPHRPYTAPKVHDPASLTLPYQYPDTRGVREDFAAYYDEIHRADSYFGKAMEYLDKNGLRDNTIVIFLGDNGAAQFRGKGTLYEFGINIPLIVRWPGVVKPGTRTEARIQSTDFYPTLLKALGIAMPKNYTIDGVDITPALKGKKFDRKPMFTFFPHSPGVPDWLPASVAVHSGDWKLIRVFGYGEKGGDMLKLYNLKDDTGEKNDLAATNPKKANELNKLIDNYLSDTKAVLPIANPAFDPSKFDPSKIGVQTNLKAPANPPK